MVYNFFHLRSVSLFSHLLSFLLQVCPLFVLLANLARLASSWSSCWHISWPGGITSRTPSWVASWDIRALGVLCSRTAPWFASWLLCLVQLVCHGQNCLCCRCLLADCSCPPH